MAEIKCIDVSTWQGDINWAKVKAAGYSHAILRAGFGREATQVDSKFEQNYKNAKAVGIKLGAYWYSYAVDKADAIKEANACLQVIKGKTFELPVFFDMEESSQTKLGKTVLTSMAKGFCDSLISAGYNAGVYSNPTWFNNYLDYNALRKKYPIWLAQYYKEAQLECDIWQYASDGTVSGISGNVDMNIIYNNSIIEGDDVVRTELKKGDKGLDVLCLKNLIQVADDMGLVDFDMTIGNDSFGRGTEKAVKKCQKLMGKTQTGVADSDFINGLCKLIKKNYPVSGDFNGDGKVDIKDVTAIQKEIAGTK